VLADFPASQQAMLDFRFILGVPLGLPPLTLQPMVADTKATMLCIAVRGRRGQLGFVQLAVQTFLVSTPRFFFFGAISNY